MSCRHQRPFCSLVLQHSAAPFNGLFGHSLSAILMLNCRMLNYWPYRSCYKELSNPFSLDSSKTKAIFFLL